MATAYWTNSGKFSRNLNEARRFDNFVEAAKYVEAAAQSTHNMVQPVEVELSFRTVVHEVGLSVPEAEECFRLDLSVLVGSLKLELTDREIRELCSRLNRDLA